MDEVPANQTIQMDSLPNLDATDETDEISTVSVSETFSSEVLTGESETFTNTTTSEAIVTSEDSILMETTASDTVTATTTTTTDSTAASSQSQPEETFTSDDIVSASDDIVSASDDIVSTETDAEVVQQCDLNMDESQNDNEEDPSIAIDQFIKKIADEQLSGKRVVPEETNNEENIQEEKETKESVDDSLERKLMEMEGHDGSSVTLVGNTNENNTIESMMDLDEVQSDEPTKDNSTLVEDLENSAEEVVPEPEAPAVKPQEKLPIITAVATVPDKQLKTYASKSSAPSVPITTNQALRSAAPKVTAPAKIVANKIIDKLKAAEVPKDPATISKAQEELRKLDVLVCGICHDVFHFVEEFSAHKSDNACGGSSSLVTQCENESKPQVWGFILWKMKQVKNAYGTKNPPSSWEIYQKWCKLAQADKNAWITAGQTIQFCSKIGNAKITENKPKSTPPRILNSSLGTEKDSHTIDLAESNKENSQNVEENNGTATELMKRGLIRPVKLNNDVTIHPSSKTDSNNSNKAIRTTKILSTQKQEYAVEKIVAKRFNPRRKTWEYQIKWENFQSDANTWEPVSNLNHCKQMLEQFEEQLRKLKEEKSKQTTIIASKGRGRPPKSPTVYRTIAPAPSGSGSSHKSNDSVGRPQRSSKQKAMDQVKAWCGTMSDQEEAGAGGGGGGVKRPFEDDDSDDSFEKRMKYDLDSDDSDSEIKSKSPIKKPQPQTSKPTTQQVISVVKNGTGTTAKQILPQNVLIPDANGVVRINQKQLPSLSTGVYIMSKTAGIIKLDSTTSKVATSGGQTIVKVAPKIGQTQIKIVKKDGNLTKQIIQVSPTKSLTPSKPAATSKSSTLIKSSTASATPVKPIVTQVKPTTATPMKSATPKTYKAVALKQKKETPKPAPKVKAVEEPPVQQDDSEESDDGIEPLEFPIDLPLPEPESPPGDFVLDPETGKIAGVEYPDPPPPVEKPEPEEEEAPTTSELENIVKLAAADITEDDLNTDPLELDEKLDIGATQLTANIISAPVSSHAPSKSNVTFVTTPKLMTSSPVVRGGPTRLTPKLVRTPSIVRNDGSILNKALTGTPTFVQKTVMNPSQRPRMQQARTYTSVVTKRGPMGSPIHVTRTVRPATQGPIRTKIMPPKPKFNIAPQAPVNRVQQRFSAVAVGASPPNKVQVYSTKSPAVQRRVGNTIIKSTNMSPQKPQARVVQTVYRASPKKETFVVQMQKTPEKRVVQQRPKAVINMPSLLDEDLQVKPQARPTPLKSEKPVVLAQQQVETPVQPQAVAVAAPATTSPTVGEVADLTSFTLADNENPIFITGDDGTVYQVAGQNEQGQTILITQGADGQQQCLLVTNEAADEQPAEVAQQQETMISVDTPVTVAGATDPVTETETMEMDTTAVEAAVKEPLQINTEPEMEMDASDQVVAQVVRAEPPSPGGTHKVVVMLPDGNLMVTQVSPEEYASLELD